MNPPDTERALLEAARELFARNGYRGTSVRAITSKAGANLGAVTYHFGSKENLYLHLIRTHEKVLRGVLGEIAARDLPALDRIDAITRRFFGYLRDNPEIGQILLQELSLSRSLPESLQAVMSLNVQTLATLIREGQREGCIVEGDSVLLALNVLAHPFYFAVASRPIRDVLGFDRSDAGVQDRIVETAAGFVRRGLRRKGVARK
jgi:AcrR family transcriptional regulator